MEKVQLLAKGSRWGREYVTHRLKSMGIPDCAADQMFFMVEQQFSTIGSDLGSTAEWSIRFEEVSGAPEDLQFDIDNLKETAIADAINFWNDDGEEG
ncbi:MAG: hypothetical protein HQL32_03465 [Planctomycetes bacterium]|nr:hypothetical protein [Planctomycetota bacterium]